MRNNYKYDQFVTSQCFQVLKRYGLPATVVTLKAPYSHEGIEMLEQRFAILTDHSAKGVVVNVDSDVSIEFEYEQGATGIKAMVALARCGLQTSKSGMSPPLTVERMESLSKHIGGLIEAVKGSGSVLKEPSEGTRSGRFNPFNANKGGRSDEQNFYNGPCMKFHRRNMRNPDYRSAAVQEQILLLLQQSQAPVKMLYNKTLGNFFEVNDIPVVVCQVDPGNSNDFVPGTLAVFFYSEGWVRTFASGYEAAVVAAETLVAASMFFKARNQTQNEEGRLFKDLDPNKLLTMTFDTRHGKQPMNIDKDSFVFDSEDVVAPFPNSIRVSEPPESQVRDAPRERDLKEPAPGRVSDALRARGINFPEDILAGLDSLVPAGAEIQVVTLEDLERLVGQKIGDPGTLFAFDTRKTPFDFDARKTRFDFDTRKTPDGEQSIICEGTTYTASWRVQSSGRIRLALGASRSNLVLVPSAEISKDDLYNCPSGHSVAREANVMLSKLQDAAKAAIQKLINGD